jgi:dUTP pyrophosphatase
MKVDFKMEEGVKHPFYAHDGDAGQDVIAYDIMGIYHPHNDKNDSSILEEEWNKNSYITIPPGYRVLFYTGITVNYIEEGHEIQIRSKSGNTLKRGYVVANSPATIDSNYRGELGVIIYNNSFSAITIEKGDKIAQIVGAKVEKINYVQGTKSETSRGKEGFGSTGRKQ